MTAFTDLLEEVLEWVLSNNTRKLMYAWHQETGIWRDVNEFIAIDHQTRTADAGTFPGQNYFYDRELDAGDSVRSYFNMDGWRWALNVDWATSIDFVRQFGVSLYAVDGTLYGCGDDSISWIRSTLKFDVIPGFVLIPSISTSEDDPPPWFIVMDEGDAVVLRLTIDNSKPKQKTKKR